MFDGRNPANQLIWQTSHHLLGLYIPDGAGFLPSTVWMIQMIIFDTNDHILGRYSTIISKILDDTNGCK